MADQEFLASFGVDIDEGGVTRLQQTLQQNMDLAESLAAAFDQARESVLSFFQQLSEENPLLTSFNPAARVTEEAQSAGIPFALDFTRANKELQSFQKEANRELKLSASAGAIVSAGTAALNQLKSLFASTSIPLKVQVSEETTVTPAPQATAPLTTPPTTIPSSVWRIHAVP